MKKEIIENLIKLWEITERNRYYSSFYKNLNYKETLKWFLEEIREFLEAIEKEDKKDIAKELGDLFHDLIFLALKLEDELGIKIEKVLKYEYEKIKFRAPHLDKKIKLSLEEEDKIWNERKKIEKDILDKILEE